MTQNPSLNDQTLSILQVLLSQKAAQYVSGIALHWYMDVFVPPVVLDQTHAANPDYFMLGTEACFLQPIELGSWTRLEAYVYDIIQVMADLFLNLSFEIIFS